MTADRLSDRAVLDHYIGLARDYPAYEPMLKLVERLSRKGYADDAKASTSHDVLVIRLHEAEYTTAIYLPDRKAFLVIYAPKGGRTMKQYANIADAETLLDCFVIRLSLASEGISTA